MKARSSASSVSRCGSLGVDSLPYLPDTSISHCLARLNLSHLPNGHLDCFETWPDDELELYSWIYLLGKHSLYSQEAQLVMFASPRNVALERENPLYLYILPSAPLTKLGKVRRGAINYQVTFGYGVWISIEPR